LTISNEDPQLSPRFPILRMEAKGTDYDKSITHPRQSIWNPKNVVHLTAQQLQQLSFL
jgi:hypothetical protein